MRRVTGTWAADFLHWGNQPASTDEDAQIATKGVTKFCKPSPDTIEWPVTDIVHDWRAGAENHGLALQSPDEAAGDGLWTFGSYDSENHPIPQLVVTMDVASAPAVRGVNIGPSYREGDSVWLKGSPSAMYALINDPAGGRMTAEFQIEHDPAVPGQGTGLIWTATSSQTSANGKPLVRIPAGIVQDGWKIRWRARAHNVTAGTVSDWSAWGHGTVATDVPEITAHEVFPSYQYEGRTMSIGLTPDLRATVTHPFADSMWVEFQMEYDPEQPRQGTGLIWESVDEDVPSGEQAVVTIPEGLVDGGLWVQWRVRASGGPFQSEWSDWQKLILDF
ncbi:hypothetical protein GCM10009555_056050 [Acrocarpospora macrocephala]|uniref:Uncharacterized protein n=1 Tax=Acrocarpospora macrocephala TaxID=150177 RepID=A0A5M3WK24_9ACTN|nr:hypothetical protein Amac_021050 [Acrocarpospora macrocephala]